MFGPFHVSVMMDSNGSNTTAAATVLAAAQHLDLSKTTAVVLGGTGPVGCRVAQLLANHGAAVRLASRSLERSKATCEMLQSVIQGGKLSPHESQSEAGLANACAGAELIIASGAAKTRLMTASQLKSVSTLKVAIDLNAVSPSGIEGIEVMDKARDHNGVVVYGAIGIGGKKMKIHHAAIQSLFYGNDRVLDTVAIYELAQSLG